MLYSTKFFFLEVRELLDLNTGVEKIAKVLADWTKCTISGHQLHHNPHTQPKRDYYLNQCDVPIHEDVTKYHFIGKCRNIFGCFDYFIDSV